jgi:hypothetical protein
VSPCRLVGEYVLEPVPTAGAKLAFAFGKCWFGVTEGQPGVEVIDRLGKGGRLHGSRVSSRALAVARDPGELILLVESHEGSAGPPSGDETIVLHNSTRQRGPYKEAPSDRADSARGALEVEPMRTRCGSLPNSSCRAEGLYEDPSKPPQSVPRGDQKRLPQAQNRPSACHGRGLPGEERANNGGNSSARLWNEMETQVGARFLGANDEIRTRDPHLGKGAWSVNGRSPPFILTGRMGTARFEASRGSKRTIASKLGEKYGETETDALSLEKSL